MAERFYVSLILVVAGLAVSEAHYWGYSSHYRQSSLPVSRSFSQSPRKSIFQSSRPRLSVLGDRFPSYADRCGDCSAAPVSQVCGSDGKTYRWDHHCNILTSTLGLQELLRAGAGLLQEVLGPAGGECRTMQGGLSRAPAGDVHWVGTVQGQQQGLLSPRLLQVLLGSYEAGAAGQPGEVLLPGQVRSDPRQQPTDIIFHQSRQVFCFRR